jgi:hypothetical protein
MKTPAQTESDTRSEFNRFEDFARKIIAVPKKEMDKKQAEYERARKKAKQKQARSQSA